MIEPDPDEMDGALWHDAFRHTDEIVCYFRRMHGRSSAADTTELAAEPTSTGSRLALNLRTQRSKISQ